jgi:hypothetical protein
MNHSLGVTCLFTSKYIGRRSPVTAPSADGPTRPRRAASPDCGRPPRGARRGPRRHPSSRPRTSPHPDERWRPRFSGVGEDRVHFLGRVDVVRECHSSPAAGIGDARVLRESGPIPQRHDHAQRLKEHDVLARRFSSPTERLVERSGSTEIADAENNERDSLVRQLIMQRAVPRKPR